MSDTTVGFLELLGADSRLVVFESKVPVDSQGQPPARPYVVVYPPGPDGQAMVANLAGQSVDFDGEWQTTIVADEADSLRLVQGWVRTAVVDQRPSIPGRVSFPIRHTGAQPARRDDDVQPPVLYATDQWRCMSVPA